MHTVLWYFVKEINLLPEDSYFSSVAEHYMPYATGDVALVLSDRTNNYNSTTEIIRRQTSHRNRTKESEIKRAEIREKLKGGC